MPEVAEPSASTEIPTFKAAPPNSDGIDEPGFGNMKEAFDKAWPASAKKEEAAPTPPPAAEPVTPTATPKVEIQAAESAPAKDELKQTVPEAIFGDKKPEPVTPEPEIVMPKSITKPEEIETWKQMRKALDTEKRERTREASEFASKLAEAKASSADPALQATVEQLRQQNQELLQAVERRSVEDHPRFRQEITLPRQQAIKEARQLLEDAQLDPRQLDKALTLPGPAQREALDNIYEKLPESAKAELAASVLQIRRLDSRREEILKNAHGTAEKLANDDRIGQHQRLQQQEQTMVKMADAAAVHLRDEKGFEAFKKSDDPNDKWWNDQVDERLSDAKALLTKVTDPAQHALAVHLAVACPFYRDIAISGRARIRELETELKAIKGAEPRLDGGGETSLPTDADDKLTFAESVARNSGLR